MKFVTIIAVVLLSILLGLIGPIYYLIDDTLFRVSSEYFVYTIIDLIVTSIAVLYFLRFKWPTNQFSSFLIHLFNNKRFVFFIKISLIICMAILAWRFNEISLFLTEGSREELVFDIGLSKSVSFAVSFAVIVVALQLSGLDLSRSFNFIPVLVLILGSALQLSRSEILFVFFYSITLYSVSHKYLVLSLRNFFLSALLIIILLIIGLIVNIQQGRADDLFSAFQNSSLAFTSYRSAALYLGHHFSSMNYSIDNIFYPFIGFPYERLITTFYQLETPLSTDNSDYFYKFISFGQEPNQIGNVFYPLGSFYYYQFGYFGIFLKSAFCIFLINLTLKFKFYFFCVYICYSILFVASVKHPLLNADSTYQALFFLVFDLMIRYLLRIQLRLKSRPR